MLLVVFSRDEVCCNGEYPVTYYFLNKNTAVKSINIVSERAF
jgi:hypothetical protein